MMKHIATLFSIIYVVSYTHFALSTHVGTECTTASDCPVSDVCIPCEDGRWPDHDIPSCIDGNCMITRRCSNEPNITSTPECTADDTSKCNIRIRCAKCRAGSTPGCTQITCVDGKCHAIEPCSSVITTTEEPTDATTTAPVASCKNDSDCPTSRNCVDRCDEGYGPLCEKAKCVQGACQTVAPCSRENQCTPDDLSRCPLIKIACLSCPQGKSPSCAERKCVDGECKIIFPCSRTDNSPPPPQCTVHDTSKCNITIKCARCLPGYTPGCTQIICVKGKCDSVEPCSIYTSTSKEPETTTQPKSPSCKTDSECKIVGGCVKQCPPGYGPHCPKAKCVNGECHTVKPCSQKNQCSKTDLSRCPISRIACRTCAIGQSPSCPKATCVDGMCQMILPCSITLKKTTPKKTTSTTKSTTTTTTTRPQEVCEDDSDCPRLLGCVARCTNGMTNRCVSVKCIEGICVRTAPCTQRSCQDSDDCPVNEDNCKICSVGYGPRCEEATCENGICHWIKPCSKSSIIKKCPEYGDK